MVTLKISREFLILPKKKKRKKKSYKEGFVYFLLK